ncbi:hypothetical protein Glove_1033g19 [Diversispora epigaea]|uniref:Uncharacterized protein n=1 Tax=Diversispora epigaea TaxID=1348612 RepID=A0A397FYB0_9GLOM|nr:hypothetical protein Glove_1033g19 [Diversispora epigaea]
MDFSSLKKRKYLALFIYYWNQLTKYMNYFHKKYLVYKNYMRALFEKKGIDPHRLFQSSFRILEEKWRKS